MAIAGWHGVVSVGDAKPGFGVSEGAGFDRGDAVFESVSSGGGVEAETGLAAGFALGVDTVVGSVADDAFRRKNGADVLIKGDF